MARESLDVFLGFVLEWEVQGNEFAHKKREALMSMATDRPVEGADFEAQVSSQSMLAQMDDLDRMLREGVE